MSDIIERLKEPEAHHPGNFDTPKRANAMLSCLCQEAMEEIESLRRELAEARQEIADRKADCETGHDQDEKTIAELRQQLAAGEAREQQLREALEGAYDYVEEAINRRIEEYGETFRPHRLEYIREVKAAADKALALPKDTTAMSALITKAGEVMRERSVGMMPDLTMADLAHVRRALRALPAVTLDDLKGGA